MNIKRTIYFTSKLDANPYRKIIFLYAFIATTIFAHPHKNNERGIQPHTHPQDEIDLMYKLDELNDPHQLSYPSTDTYLKQSQNNITPIIDDDFDLGNDEIDLQKIDLNTDDLEIAKEYETFLKAANLKRSTTKIPQAYNNDNFVHLNDKIKTLESERKMLNQNIDNLENQLKSTESDNDRINSLEHEKRLLNQKIENLENQLKSTESDKSFDDLKAEYDKLKLSIGLNDKTVNPYNRSRYRVSAIMGATIPIFQDGYSIGTNVGLRLETPISFNLVGMEAKVGTDIYSSSMLPSGNNSLGKYSLINIVGNVSITPFNRMNNQHLSSMEIISGLGLTVGSISEDQTEALSIHIDINYYLPVNLSGFNFGFNLHNQLTMDHPVSNNTTSLINASLLIKTPLQF